MQENLPLQIKFLVLTNKLKKGKKKKSSKQHIKPGLIVCLYWCIYWIFSRLTKIKPQGRCMQQYI